MIALASECLVVKMPGGQAIPCSPEMIDVEVEGDAPFCDREFLSQAMKAVFHYFQHELGRQAVSAREFAGALEKVLQGFGLTVRRPAKPAAAAETPETDLGRLAHACGLAGELAFYPRLRVELRRHLQTEMRVLRLRGLRSCVKHLAGARRWSRRCRNLEAEIVTYLRACLSSEAAPKDFALVVE